MKNKQNFLTGSVIVALVIGIFAGLSSTASTRTQLISHMS